MEPLRLPAKRCVEPSALVEAPQAVEARPVQKQEIVRIPPIIEPLAHAVVVILSIAQQRRTLTLKELAHCYTADDPRLYGTVEVDQVRITVAQ